MIIVTVVVTTTVIVVAIATSPFIIEVAVTLRIIIIKEVVITNWNSMVANSKIASNLAWSYDLYILYILNKQKNNYVIFIIIDWIKINLY